MSVWTSIWVVHIVQVPSYPHQSTGQYFDPDHNFFLPNPCHHSLSSSHLKMAVFWGVAPYSLVILMMEAASSSEMSVSFYQTTWHNISEDSHLHAHHCEILNLIFSCHWMCYLISAVERSFYNETHSTYCSDFSHFSGYLRHPHSA
jgi:hypothetical protein